MKPAYCRGVLCRPLLSCSRLILCILSDTSSHADQHLFGISWNYMVFSTDLSNNIWYYPQAICGQ